MLVKRRIDVQPVVDLELSSHQLVVLTQLTRFALSGKYFMLSQIGILIFPRDERVV